MGQSVKALLDILYRINIILFLDESWEKIKLTRFCISTNRNFLRVYLGNRNKVDFDTFDTVNRLIEFGEFTGVRGWGRGVEGRESLPYWRMLTFKLEATRFFKS